MSELQKIVQFPTVANIENLSLNQLADAANRESTAGDEAFVRGLQHYKACGEYLIAAKSKGKTEIGSSFRWSEWLKDNWKKHYSMANRCMKIASDWEKITTHGNFSENLGLNAALQLASVQADTIDVEVVETTIENPETIKQLDQERKSREKAEKELAKLNKQELALKATQDENKQLLSLVEGLQNQIATMQKPEVRTVTVIDDSATKELEKVKAELAEKDKQLSKRLKIETPLTEGAKRMQLIEKNDIQEIGIEKYSVKRAYFSFKDNSLGFLRRLAENSEIPNDSKIKQSAIILLETLKEIDK